MPLVDNSWYVNYGDGTAGAGKKSWFDVTVWATGTVTAAGALRRQLATPTVGNERVFVCIIAGTTHATTEPTWVLTRGAKTTDNTVTWQECTGIAAINGDATNTPSWTVTATPPGGVKNTAVVLGQVIKRDNGASYQICTTAGTAGNGAEPGFSDTAGTTTADGGTLVWTSLGVVGNFTGWQAPHARIASACTATWVTAGNEVYVGDNHAETQGSAITITAGSIALPVYINCVDRSVAVPPTTVAATATVTTTGAFGITVQGGNGANLYVNGIIFNTGTGASAANLILGGSGVHTLVMENCGLVLATTSASSVIRAQSGNGNYLILRNTTAMFGSTSQRFNTFGGTVGWENTLSAIAGATIPTTLFTNTAAGSIRARGVDFSALGSGTLIGGANTEDNFFIDCKLGASAVVSAAPSQRSWLVNAIRCDSAGTNYRTERYGYMGTQTMETTIVRTGGASDGTTPVSWKIVSTANSVWAQPFASLPIAIWNDTTGSHTVTIYGTTTGGGVPNNDDIWIETQYLGDASSPQGSFMTTTKANNLAASVTTNNSSDASTWGGGGAGNGFKMVTPSFTVNQKGYLSVVVKVAKVSSTYYIDPLIVVS